MEPYHFHPFVPLLWFLLALVIVITAMWFKHQRRMVELELIRTYVSQNKEPPVELMNAMRVRCSYDRYSPARRWRLAVSFGSLAAGFGLAHWVVISSSPDRHFVPGLLIPAIIFGCVAVGQAILALITRPSNQQ